MVASGRSACMSAMSIGTGKQTSGAFAKNGIDSSRDLIFESKLQTGRFWKYYIEAEETASQDTCHA